jgi:glycosyltransferase involved in cell wall biosynthesis
MEKYGIVTSYTTSLTVVANDIAYAFKKLGHNVEVFNNQVLWVDAKKLFTKGIVFIPFDPIYAPTWFLLQRDYTKYGIPSFTYVTVEGEPKKWLLKDWIKRDCTFVANSEFTSKMINRIGIEPIRIVYHGVNLDLINKIKEKAGKLKEQLKENFGKKVVFGTVASNHRRKGLDKLLEVVKLVSEKTDDVLFYIITTTNGSKLFTGLKNVYVSSDFGKLDREKILLTIGSFDFYLNPTYCEGFGLPLLEANAFGIPCIYPDYEPLTEITNPDSNFPVPVINEEFKDFGDGILYLIHDYRPVDMALKVLEAYRIYTEDYKKYKSLSKENEENAKKFDAIKVYSELTKIV